MPNATDEYPTSSYNVCCIAGYGDVSLEGKFSHDLFNIISKLSTDDNVAVCQLIAYGINEVNMCVGVCLCVLCCVCRPTHYKIQ